MKDLLDESPVEEIQESPFAPEALTFPGERHLGIVKSLRLDPSPLEWWRVYLKDKGAAASDPGQAVLMDYLPLKTPDGAYPREGLAAALDAETDIVIPGGFVIYTVLALGKDAENIRRKRIRLFDLVSLVYRYLPRKRSRRGNNRRFGKGPKRFYGAAEDILLIRSA
ncbi:MAG: hypothetical protein LBR53_01450 [Deltaproteobacteria bacterium]|jgi:hypothetical protein|nr:hypothetical protein [Deltaproteobacteria bacterium]